MKNRTKSILFILIAYVLCSCALSACTPHWAERQCDVKNAIWQTEDNPHGIKIEVLALPYSTVLFGYIEYNGQKKEVALNWGVCRFCLYLADHYGRIMDYGEDTDIGNKNISGSYDIIDDYTVELEIHTDDFYDNSLRDKKVVIAAHAINPLDYGIGLFQEVCWESTAKDMTLYTHQGTRRFSVGKVKTTDSTTDIVMYWLDNKTFTAYELVDNVQQQEVLLSGNYTYDGTTLTLNYTNNLINELQSHNLYMRDIELGERPQKIWHPEPDMYPAEE